MVMLAIALAGASVWAQDGCGCSEMEEGIGETFEDLTQGTPLSFLLGVGNLTKDFSCRPLSAKPPEDGLTYLELLPRSSIPGLAYIQLGVHPGNDRIGALRMVDKQGNTRQLRLRQLRIGVKFPPGHFTFEIKEGMEVIGK